MSSKIDYGTHRLVNRRTKRLSSSTNWLLDLAAVAVQNSDHTGIAALLPQTKARKLLLKNELKSFKQHKKRPVSPTNESSHRELRMLANKAYPTLVLFYVMHVVGGHHPSSVNRKGFRAWLMSSLADPNSKLNIFLAQDSNFSALAELNRKDDWWRKTLKTESKSKQSS